MTPPHAGEPHPREHRYILNRNPGMDIVHVDPVEECNVDDAEDRQKIDPETADALVKLGEARYCDHCGLANSTGGTQRSE